MRTSILLAGLLILGGLRDIARQFGEINDVPDNAITFLAIVLVVMIVMDIVDFINESLRK